MCRFDRRLISLRLGLTIENGPTTVGAQSGLILMKAVASTVGAQFVPMGIPPWRRHATTNRVLRIVRVYSLPLSFDRSVTRTDCLPHGSTATTSYW